MRQFIRNPVIDKGQRHQADNKHHFEKLNALSEERCTELTVTTKRRKLTECYHSIGNDFNSLCGCSVKDSVVQ